MGLFYCDRGQVGSRQWPAINNIGREFNIMSNNFVEIHIGFEITMGILPTE